MPTPVPGLPLEVAPALRSVRLPTLADGLAEEDDDEDARDGAERVLALTAPGLPGTRRGWAILAAAVMLLLVGAGVSAAMLGEDDRPSVEPTIRYADDTADFRFRYPDGWRVEQSTGPCTNTAAELECIRVVFEIGPDVDADEANTLQVRSLNTEEDLDALHDWVTKETQIIVGEIPNFRLLSADTTRLAGAPAFRAELVDTSSPTTRLVVYEGRTTSGRALVVTLTVRDPRTAATDEEFRKLLESITSS